MSREFHIYKIWLGYSTGRTMRLEPTKYNISSKKLPSLANTSQVKNPQVQVAAACKRYIENIRAQRYYKLNV